MFLSIKTIAIYNLSRDFKKTCISLRIFPKPLQEMIESFGFILS